MLILQKKLITVDIFYYLPDYPSIIQEFLWQTEDLVPELTRVKRFLNYWKNNIEADIQSIYVFESDGGFRKFDFELVLD